MADVRLIAAIVERPANETGEARCFEGAALGPKLRGEGVCWWIGAPNVDDAAGRVAVERRRRAANHLDAPDRLQIEIVERGLTVGVRERHAIAKNSHAANTERRA